jgi:hypothetical protein
MLNGNAIVGWRNYENKENNHYNGSVRRDPFDRDDRVRSSQTRANAYCGLPLR